MTRVALIEYAINITCCCVFIEISTDMNNRSIIHTQVKRLTIVTLLNHDTEFHNRVSKDACWDPMSKASYARATKNAVAASKNIYVGSKR